MRVIKRLALELFYKKWPAAERPMSEWWSRAKRAKWRNFAEVKNTFGQTDQAKVDSGNTVLIFDVGGNKYRIIAAVSYPKQKLCILRVFTHKEYDQQPWKEQL